MVKYNSKYDKYVDIVDKFLDSSHYSILIEVEEGEKAKPLRYRLIDEFGDSDLFIRQRKNFVHVEKRVI